MARMGELEYLVKLDTKELETGIHRAESYFNQLAGRIAGIAATIGVAFGMKQLVDDVKQLTVNFDAAMREVWTLTNLTEAEFAKLREQVIELSKDAPYSANELARALYQAVSAGIDVSKSMEFMRVAIQAATAGAADLFTAVDGLTTVLNAWGLQVNEVSRVSDAFFVAIRDGKTTFDELAHTIGRVAPIAAQAGVSLEEILAAVAALTKQGLSTEQAMTGLAYAIQSIVAPTEQAKKAAESLGIEFNVFKLQSEGFAGFLKYVAEAAGNNMEAMDKLFSSMEALRAVLALTGKGAAEFERILGNMNNAFGQTQTAAEKMNQSLEVQIQRLKNMFDAIKLKLGEALTPAIEKIVELGYKFASWVENMTPAEKAILGISAALLALIPVIKTATFVWGLLSAVSGSWVAALAGIGAILGTLTVAFGMMRQDVTGLKDSIAGVNKEVDQLAESTQELSERAWIQSIAANTERTYNAVTATEKRVQEIIEATEKLVQLVVDYNYAQEIGLGNAQEIKKQIDELLKTYPALSSAVALVGDKYEIQAEKLREILQLELQRIDLALQQARAEIKALEQTRQQRAEAEAMYRRMIEREEEAQKATEKLMRKYEDLAKSTTDPTKKQVYEALAETYRQAYETSKKYLQDWTQKHLELLDIRNKELELQQKVVSLEQVRAQLTERIAKIETGEFKPEPTIAKQMRDLDQKIAEVVNRLKQYRERTTKEYETELSLLELYVSRKKSLLNTMAAYMVEQGKSVEEVRKILAQVTDLEKLVEQFKPERETKIVDIEEIRKGLTALEELAKSTDERSKELGERLYRTTKETILAGILRAMTEGNKEILAQLESLWAELMAFTPVYEKEEVPKEVRKLEDTLEEIDKLYEALRNAVKEGNYEVARGIYSDLSRLVTDALTEAYAKGDEALKRKLHDIYASATEEFKRLSETAFRVEQLQTLQQQLEALRRALAEGNVEMAQKIYEDLIRWLTNVTQEAFIAGNEELFKQWKGYLEQIKQEFSALFERVDVSVFEKQIEQIKQALYAGERELAYELADTLLATLTRVSIEAWTKGEMELYNTLEALRERVEKILERDKRFQQAQQEEIKKTAQAYEDLGDVLEKNLRRYENYETMMRLLELEEELAGADLRRKIEIYQELIQLRKRLGEETEDYEKQLEKLIEREKQELEYQKQLQRELEATARWYEVQREIEREAFEKAQQRRWADVQRYYEELERKRQREAEEARQKELEQIKKNYDYQARFLNTLISSIARAIRGFGEIGSLVASILENVQFTVEEIKQDGEIIGYRLVNPFERLEELTANIRNNIALWAVGQIANWVQQLVANFSAFWKQFDKFAESGATRLAQLLRDFREFEENLSKRTMLVAGQLASRTLLAGLGGIAGFLLGGPLGALLGTALGGVFGNTIAGAFQPAIDELEKRLGVTIEQIKNALGTSVEDIASALKRAFSADTYEDFVTNFSQALEEMTKQALIEAFLASETVQPLLKGISDLITAAVLDGVLTAEELRAIKEAGKNLANVLGPFFDVLKELFPSTAPQPQLPTGRETTAAETIRASITEETANRLEAIFNTINLNVNIIKDVLKNGIIRVQVVNTSLEAQLRAMG